MAADGSGNIVTSSWLPRDDNSVKVVAKLIDPHGNPVPFEAPVTFKLSSSAYPGVAINDTEGCTNGLCTNDFGFSLGRTSGPIPPETVQATGLGNISKTLYSFDFGGKMTIQVSTTVNSDPVTAGLTLPKDSDGDGLPDAYESDPKYSQAGLNAYNANTFSSALLDGDVDMDTSLGSAIEGDGLTNFEEYRGVVLNKGTHDHLRLNPIEKDLFVRGDGFKNSWECVCTGGNCPSQPAFCNDPDVLPFTLGPIAGDPNDPSGSTFKNAFENAGIAVHDVTGNPAFMGLSEPPSIDIAAVSNNTVTTSTIRASFDGYINHPKARNWTWDEKGASYYGDGSYYSYDPYRGHIGGTFTYHLNLMHYFYNRPYLNEPAYGQAVAAYNDQASPLLEPLNLVEDYRNENGIGPEKFKGKTEDYIVVNGKLDGDRMKTDWMTHPYSSNVSYKVGYAFSTLDSDGDGKVELPVLTDSIVLQDPNPPKEYPPAVVQRHTAVHELGHAVGVKNPEHTADPSCVMYQSSNNWDRAGKFSADALSQIQIHNKTEAYQDIDGDGVQDVFDNCPANPNPDQTDADCDKVGDVCDAPY